MNSIERLADRIRTANLVIRAQSGDTKAFETLLIERVTKLLYLAIHYTRDNALAEACTKKAIAQAAEGLMALEDPYSFDVWIVKMVREICLDTIHGTKQVTKSGADDTEKAKASSSRSGVFPGSLTPLFRLVSQ